MVAIINKTAPQPEIECWVQGSEPSISELTDQVILIEMIQVNCPGCFIHALPEAIKLHEIYQPQGLKVFAIATAFEHFELNTLENLQVLLQHGDVVGEPLMQLDKAGFLVDSMGTKKLPYAIPFSVAMDKLIKNDNDNDVNETIIDQFIISQIPDFHKKNWPEERKHSIYQQAASHLNNKQFHARTFEMYQLQGTPSSILIDKKGLLRKVLFGAVNTLENEIQQLLNES